MANNFYLGNVSDLASNMGSMFGGSSTQGITFPPVKSPLVPSGPTETTPQSAVGGKFPPVKSPLKPAGPMEGLPQAGAVTGSGPATPSTFNPLASQSVRPTSFGGFDPSYGQNLATFIGQSFQRPQTNQPLQFNPYGSLGDANVQYPNLGGGNAPLPGLPQTLLQWAQWFNPTALAGPTTTGTGADNSYGTNVNNAGPRRGS